MRVDDVLPCNTVCALGAEQLYSLYSSIACVRIAYYMPQRMDQLDMVGNPARGQPNTETVYLFPVLVSA